MAAAAIFLLVSLPALVGTVLAVTRRATRWLPFETGLVASFMIVYLAPVRNPKEIMLLGTLGPLAGICLGLLAGLYAQYQKRRRP